MNPNVLLKISSKNYTLFKDIIFEIMTNTIEGNAIIYLVILFRNDKTINIQ